MDSDITMTAIIFCYAILEKTKVLHFLILLIKYNRLRLCIIVSGVILMAFLKYLSKLTTLLFLSFSLYYFIILTGEAVEAPEVQ